MTTYRLGVDAGGTFTDFILADDQGNTHLFKATSTPEDGTRAIAEGFAQIAEKMRQPIGAILANTQLCVNGTTVALNALIQHKGVKTGLLCTAGHEDSLEIRLGHKEEGYRYDAEYPPVKQLVERQWRMPIRERILADGSARCDDFARRQRHQLRPGIGPDGRTLSHPTAGHRQLHHSGHGRHIL